MRRLGNAGASAGALALLRLTLIDGTAGPEAGQAACIEMTQDFGAFAVILTPAISRDVARCTAVTNETHDIPLVMSISDRIYCLEAGSVISSGRPDQVRNDPLVVASYLGTDEQAIARSAAPAAASASAAMATAT